MDSNKTTIWAESGIFEIILKTYTAPKDIKEAPHRILISSYHPKAEKPIIYRHYHHILDNPNEFNSPKKIYRDCCTIFIMLRHSVQLIINDEAYIPLPGDIVILRKDSTFQPVFLSMDYFDYYEINIPEEYFDLVAGFSPVHSLILGKDNKDNIILSPSDESREEIFHILKKIDHTLNQNHKHKDFLVYSYLMRFFAFVDTCVIPEIENTKKLNSSPIVRKAVEYINENYLTISQVEEIAGHCHISVSYLCRIFRKQLGISPTEFINSRKIIHAKHLLKKGHNVTNVCFASGFNSYNYFITLFKKSTGQTPVKYRKTAKE